MKGSLKRAGAGKKLISVIVLTLLGVAVFAAAYPIMAGVVGGSVAGY